MQLKKIFADKVAWGIVLFYAIWTRFFNFYLLSGFTKWYLIEETITLLLFLAMIPQIVKGLNEKTIAKNVSQLLVMFAFSTLWAYIYWDQGFYHSIRGLTGSCLLLVLFYLFRGIKVDIKSITHAIFILSFIYCVCMTIALATFPNCVFGDFLGSLSSAEDFEKTFEHRGVMRLPVPGADFIILAIFIIISKYRNQKRMFLWLIPLVAFLLQRGTRTPIFITLAISVIFLVWSMKNKFLVIFITAVVFLASFFAYSVIIESNSDNMIVKYIQMSNEQIEKNENNEKDIRVQMASFYLTEFNNDNILKNITGNGIPSGEGAYAKNRDYLMDTKHFFVEDVGYVQIFIWFGFIGLILYVKLLLKSIKIPRNKDYTFGLLYVIYLFVILPTNSSLTTLPIFLSIAVYVLYLEEKSSLYKKKDIRWLRKF